MDKKGQSAFEMVMVTGIIFIFLLIAYGNYFFPSETFNVSAEAKLAAVNALNKYAEGHVSIKEIKMEITEEKYIFNVVTYSEIQWKTDATQAETEIKEKAGKFTGKDIEVTFST
ncbi:MAG: hypothetical protein ABIA76_04935 [Candidatus Diapherotrites archaeon]